MKQRTCDAIVNGNPCGNPAIGCIAVNIRIENIVREGQITAHEQALEVCESCLKTIAIRLAEKTIDNLIADVPKHKELLNLSDEEAQLQQDLKQAVRLRDSLTEGAEKQAAALTVDSIVLRLDAISKRREEIVNG